MGQYPIQHATLCFLIRGDPPQEILLGYKKAGLGADKYNGFGGKVQDGETIAHAAAREMEEESGVKVREQDLRRVAHLTFRFPARPAWDQVVHVFLATRWEGQPTESREMAPAWFALNEIPFARTWADDQHWLPRILAGERVRAWFTFGEDNESIDELRIEPWDGHCTEGET